MQNKNTPKRKNSSKKTNPLAPYRDQARRFIRLYFDEGTPDFVHDLLSSWYNNLENKTQVFWNYREVAEIALPLMLQKAAAMGIDLESRDSDFCFDVLRDTTNGIEVGRAAASMQIGVQEKIESGSKSAN